MSATALKPAPVDSPWLNAKDAAEYLGGDFHPESLRQMARSHEIPAVKVSERRWRFHTGDLDAWMRAKANTR